MQRKLTPRSTLESLRREAKRWLRALRANDLEARARLDRAYPQAPSDPGLRDVQHALAREHGLAGWTALREALAELRPDLAGAADEPALPGLLAAAAGGDVTGLGALLDERPDLASARGHLPGHTGLRTALHFAVGGSHESVVALLLERGADPNVRDEGDNATPLHFAAEKEHLGIIRLLVESGADPIGEGDGHELEVIGWATCFGSGRRDVVDYLLAHGARHNIFSGVAMGEAEVVRALVARTPTDLERRMDGANRHRTPLHLAVIRKQLAVVATLLDLGAATEARDAGGLTPLDQAALTGEAEIVQLLLDRGAALDLPAAVALQRTADVERLLGADPGALRTGGRWATLIVRASEDAPAHVVETLLRAGASVDARDDTRTAVDSTAGYTPLHAAAFRGNAPVVAVLLAHGADVNARESRYCGTPAGWADYAGHLAVRDMILAGPIDLFEAIEHDRVERISDILGRDPGALERPFGAYVTCAPEDDRNGRGPWRTPLAVAVTQNRSEVVRTLLALGADSAVRAPDGRSLVELARADGHDAIAGLLEQHARGAGRSATDDHAERVAAFLRTAALDWRVGGAERVARTHDAARLLRRHPEIARDGLFTAVVCGELAEVERILARRPEAATEIGGPREWPPLLYLCNARLPFAAASEDTVAIARALLDGGADPNAYYPGGDPSIHYSALTGVLGRGEEQASTHPQAGALAQLLMERGAEPYDVQVLYNVFAGHASRRVLGDDIVWLLELVHAHSVRRGREADWHDPEWKMLDLGGYGHGAYYLLSAAVERNHLGLAQWLLAHGASPDAPPPEREKPPRTPMERATRRGFTAMAELLRAYGAAPDASAPHDYDRFLAACLRVDRVAAREMAERHPEYLGDPRAMFEAADQDRVDVAEFLLDLGVSPDVEDPGDRRRPLHVAAYSGALRVAALLVERGAEVDFRESAYGATPIGIAVWGQQPRLAELLGRYSRDVWNLAGTGNVERLREVLAAEPALARLAHTDGETPLMRLPNDEARALEVVQLFLAHGADPTRRDSGGRSAAELAARRALDDVAELLRTRGG